jgi:hypothetical protein
MKLNTFFLRIIFSAALCLVVIGVIAQPGDPINDPDVPITGIEILLAIGGILGLRKFITSKQKSSR